MSLASVTSCVSPLHRQRRNPLVCEYRWRHVIYFEHLSGFREPVKNHSRLIPFQLRLRMEDGGRVHESVWKSTYHLIDGRITSSAAMDRCGEQKHAPRWPWKPPICKHTGLTCMRKLRCSDHARSRNRGQAVRARLRARVSSSAFAC